MQRGSYCGKLGKIVEQEEDRCTAYARRKRDAGLRVLLWRQLLPLFLCDELKLCDELTELVLQATKIREGSKCSTSM